MLPSQDRPTPRHPVFARLLASSIRAPAVVAHRGKSDTHPENTLPAFEAAVDVGSDVIEFDVRQCEDRRWVCIHDATTDRTTDSRARRRADVEVASTSWDELAELDAGRWKDEAFAGTRLPDLEQALTAIHRGATAMIEHKAGDPADMVRELRRLDVVDRVIVQSFDWEFVAAVRRLEPKIATGLLGPTKDHPNLDERALERASAIGTDMVHWNARRLKLAEVDAARAAGFAVCTYTTDDELGWLGQTMAGVDLITTNRPLRLRELIGNGQLTRR